MANDNIAMDGEGRSLPYTDEQIKAIVMKAMADGKILAVIIEMPNGEVAMPVMGGPSEKLAVILEATAHAYRTNLQGH